MYPGFTKQYVLILTCTQHRHISDDLSQTLIVGWLTSCRTTSKRQERTGRIWKKKKWSIW